MAEDTEFEARMARHVEERAMAEQVTNKRGWWRLWTKTVIRGCEARGDADSPYLTRYAFLRLGPVRPCLHVFHRSDADELHDHPWPFVSIILWRGYVEVARCSFEEFRKAERAGKAAFAGGGAFTRRKRVWPGAVLFRKATHAHRVELLPDRAGNPKPAVTLVFMGTRVRDWGFFTARGWQRFTEYFRERGC